MEKNDTQEKQLWLKGTVKYLPMEGGFFGIVTEQGKKLNPINLGHEFRQEGAMIKFKGSYKQDMISFQQWGELFHLSEVILLKKGKPVPKSNQPTH